jgi:hypothetical protein
MSREALLFVESFFLHSKNLFFGLEPVVNFRARLIAAQDVELVGPATDLVFNGKCFDRGFLCTYRRHVDYLPQPRYHRPYLTGGAVSWSD